MKRSVFISHSSKDKPIGEEVCRFLEAHGIPCWIAPRDVTPGKNYGAAIVDAIDECPVFVLVLSSDSNKSGQVVREVERAASSDSIIIPFRVEDVQPSRNLEFYVSSAHWLDAVTKPFDKHLRELLKAIQDWQESGVTKYDRTASAPASSATGSPVSPAVTPPLPQIATPRARLFAILGAVAAGILLATLAGYGLVRHNLSQKRLEAGPTIALQVTPSPSITIAPVIEPSPTVAATLAAPSFTPSPLPSEVPTATKSPIAFASPIRRRPGESFGSAMRSPTAAASIAPTPLPVNKSAEELTPAAPPIIEEVAASSELKVGAATRRPGLAFDGNTATAWVPEKDGVGQSISVHFKSPATITSVSILNSAAPDEAHYRIHNRVHTLRLTLSDGATQVLTFEDKKAMQRFELQHPSPTEWIKFEILSVFRGAKINHTPIAEIDFNRDTSPPVRESPERQQSEPRRRRSPPPKSGY
jgi:hypothetical protein